ncbi:MAG: hypothetical protein ACREVL_14590 [Solimonas sp.]
MQDLTESVHQQQLQAELRHQQTLSTVWIRSIELMQTERSKAMFEQGRDLIDKGHRLMKLAIERMD